MTPAITVAPEVLRGSSQMLVTVQSGLREIWAHKFRSVLTMLGITLFFATDMHHLVIAALNDSYNLFQPGEVPATGDAAALITRTVSGAFRIGIQLSAPFLVFGLLFNIGLGVLSRLMPQMQVFFVALPLSILLGLLFLVLVLGAMMGLFLDYAGGVLHALAPHA